MKDKIELDETFKTLERQYGVSVADLSAASLPDESRGKITHALQCAMKPPSHLSRQSRRKWEKAYKK